MSGQTSARADTPVPAIAETVALTLPDGGVRTVARGTTGAELAAMIGPGLAKAALAVKLDGRLADLSRPIEADARIEIVTRKSAEALEMIRHDAAHVMAEAVQELYPGTQVTIGPAIDNGFYYDFWREQPFTPDDLPRIEEKMREIVARDARFTREVWDRGEAIRFFEARGERFKAELIRDLPETETITVYRQGQWLDLCRGPHLPSTGGVGDAFKLMKLAGAYWRGDSTRPMLQRIYGTAWRDRKELDAHLHMLEEAEKRDHRRLGREMDLFHLQEEAAGSVFWHPRGWTLFRTLETYVRRKLDNAGYLEIRTPQLIDRSLFTASGHWEMYGDNMYKVVADEEKVFGLKPMNCPGHVQVYKQGIKSYRDLPLRFAEFGSCHRNEPSGALHGIMRVRQFTQDDAHIFCTPEQVTDEAIAYIRLQLEVYRDLGFSDVRYKLALRPDVRAGTDDVWDRAEQGLRDAMAACGLAWEEMPNEGAFYGPKIEFHLTDAIGRSWQCGTLQMDFVLPERLDATYVGEDGLKHRPVMLHRAMLGSVERFVGVLVEHFAGRLPLWLAPVQVVVATITSDGEGYAREVANELVRAGVRAEIDVRNEKINLKIREHSLAKVPVIAVVGRREAEERKVALRRLGGQDQEVLALDAAVAHLRAEAESPAGGLPPRMLF